MVELVILLVPEAAVLHGVCLSDSPENKFAETRHWNLAEKSLDRIQADSLVPMVVEMVGETVGEIQNMASEDSAVNLVQTLVGRFGVSSIEGFAEIGKLAEMLEYNLVAAKLAEEPIEDLLNKLAEGPFEELAANFGRILAEVPLEQWADKFVGIQTERLEVRFVDTEVGFLAGHHRTPWLDAHLQNKYNLGRMASFVVRKLGYFGQPGFVVLENSADSPHRQVEASASCLGCCYMHQHIPIGLAFRPFHPSPFP